MHRDQKLTEEEREHVIRQLREFIIALDLRLPHIERAGEVAIAHDAAVLREGVSANC